MHRMSQEHAILWASLIIRDNMLPTCIQPSRHSNILDADFLILNASVTYEKNLLIWIYHIHLNCPNFFFYNISQTDFLRQLLKTFKDRQRRSLLLSIILIHKKNYLYHSNISLLAHKQYITVIICRANDRANLLRHCIAINDGNPKTSLFQQLSFSLQPDSYIV